MQRSESFILGALLSFSGGLQDAYTFNVRDRVFANAQTGNVVLMSQNFMLGNWQKGSDYLFPIISFIEKESVQYRIEHDSVGDKQVPAGAYYGVQTLRAAENFPITGLNMHPEIVNSIAYIKKAAAMTNCDIGKLDSKKAEVIVRGGFQCDRKRYDHHPCRRGGTAGAERL